MSGCSTFGSKSVGPPALHTQHATLLLVRELVQRWRAPPQHAKRAEERPAFGEGRGHGVPLLGRSSQRVLQHRPQELLLPLQQLAASDAVYEV